MKPHDIKLCFLGSETFFFLANQQPNLKTHLPRSQNTVFQSFLDLVQINKKLQKKYLLI